MTFNNISYIGTGDQFIALEKPKRDKEKKVNFNFLKSPRKQEVPSTFLRQRSLTQLPVVPPQNVPRCIAPENGHLATVNNSISMNGVTIFNAGEQDDAFTVFSKLLFKIYQCGFAKSHFSKGLNLNKKCYRSPPFEISDQVHFLRILTLEDLHSKQFQERIKKALTDPSVHYWIEIQNLCDKHIPSMAINWSSIREKMDLFRSNYNELRENDPHLYEHLLLEEFIQSLIPAYKILKLMTVNQLSMIKSLVENIFPRFNDNPEISKGKQKLIIRDMKQSEDGYEHPQYDIQIFKNDQYKVTLTKKSGIYPKPEGYAHDVNQKIAILTLKWILTPAPCSKQNNELHLEALSFTPFAQNSDISTLTKALQNWSLPDGVSKHSEEVLTFNFKK